MRATSTRRGARAAREPPRCGGRRGVRSHPDEHGEGGRRRRGTGGATGSCRAAALWARSSSVVRASTTTSTSVGLGAVASPARRRRTPAATTTPSAMPIGDPEDQRQLAAAPGSSPSAPAIDPGGLNGEPGSTWPTVLAGPVSADGGTGRRSASLGSAVSLAPNREAPTEVPGRPAAFADRSGAGGRGMRRQRPDNLAGHEEPRRVVGVEPTTRVLPTYRSHDGDRRGAVPLTGPASEPGR